MTTNKLRRLLPFLLLIVPVLCYAQSFGFGFDDEWETGGSSSTSILPFDLKIGGKIEAGQNLFIKELVDENGPGINPLDIVSAKLNFTAAGTSADAFIGFNFSRASLAELWDGGPGAGQTPLLIEEAWLRTYLDSFTVEGGLIKLKWGRMDSSGPLDVVNPLDYRDLTLITDSNSMKISRPMIHASWLVDGFTKVEAVFVPYFLGHQFAEAGRWVPGQFSDLPTTAINGIMARAEETYSTNPLYAMIKPTLQSGLETELATAEFDLPDTTSVDYFQAGLRFTTTIGSADFGAQYFYGNFFRPDFSINGVDNFLSDVFNFASPRRDPSPSIKYNRYHQIGIDYAQVIAGFNVRAEFAAHLTNDFSGDDGAVRNPFLAWAVGFDRTLPWDINVNFQCNETIRLLDDKVTKNPAIDSEGDSDITATRLTLQLSKVFFRDIMECKVIGIWDIEDNGFCIIPAVSWTMNDVKAELSGGIFLGDEKSEMGYYWKNNFIKLGISYLF